MPLYSTEVRICGTAYTKANSAEEARAKVKAFITHTSFCFEGEKISEKSFNDPALPKVSLSPIMTGHGIWPNALTECVE